MLTDLSSLAQLRGEIGWSTVSDAGISQVEVPTVSDAGANPDVSATTDWLTEAVTVPDSTRWRQALPRAGSAVHHRRKRQRIPGRLDVAERCRQDLPTA